MKILKYEKIEVNFYQWTPVYLKVAKSLIDLISTDKFKVIHIGSTSFKVGGKGIIDLSILYKDGYLTNAINHLQSLGFQDQISEKPFPSERPRKDGSVMLDGSKYFLHIHVIAYGSNEHKMQLAYKNHMLNNQESRNKYEATKKEVLISGIKEQEAYGKLKSPYVKSVLAKLS